jgi:hypothetical protein
MKNTKYKLILIALISIPIFISCEKDFGDINVNPNAPTTTNPDFIFTEALITGAQMDASRDFGIWAGLTASDEGLERKDNYYLPSELAINTWVDCYSIIANLNEIVKIVENDPYYVNKLAVTRIWRAYVFGRLTDLYGDIPYSEAAQGNTAQFIIAPIYDTQKSIYISLLDELKDAISKIDNISTALGNYKSADIVYNGDLTKWIKFGNSLMLRMALRISNAEPELAREIVTEIMTQNQLMSANSDGFHFKFNKDFKAATYYFYSAGLARILPSKFIVDMMLVTSDPRLPIYAQHPEKGISVTSYRGMPSELTVDERIAEDYNFKKASHVGSYFLREDVVGFTLSYAEVCFMKAEAALKGWGASTADAETFYKQGVTASMSFFKTFTPTNDLQKDPFTEITLAQINDYLSGPGKFEGTDEEKFEKIITQRWITLYQEGGYEAYALVRRTHYPRLKNYYGNYVDLDNDLLQRMPYPIEEYSLNGDNAKQADARQGKKVWWSK